jgi:3-oxoacyl-[acyl-carrier protein] reductase
MDLAGRTALVTGGSRGIGRAVVEQLARHGAAVMFSYAQDEPAASDVARTVAEAGGRALPARSDAADISAIRELFARADREFGGLDIVVLNAGVADGGLIAEQDAEVYDRIMAVNARGTFFGLQEAARRVRAGGSIVAISSINTVLREQGAAVYSASKAAVEQFAYIAAKELGPRGITVNVVSPGATDTDMLRGVNPPEFLDEIVKLSALGRLGQPDDVARVVAFLVGPTGQWITGQNLRADGGVT